MSSILPAPWRVLARSRTAALAVLISVVLLTSSGCATGGQDRPRPVAAFKESYATWRLPLDDRVVDAVRVEHASSVGYSRCMAAHAIRVPVVDPADYLGASTNTNLRRLFTSALAGRYGYHAAPSRLHGLPPSAPRLDAAQRGVAQQCDEVTRRRLPAETRSTTAVEHLASAAYDEARRDPQVKRLDADWRECLASRVLVTDLPSSPLDMPSAQQKRLFGWTGTPSGATPPLHAVEVRQASADAQCRAATGNTERLYEVEVLAQLRLAHRFPRLVHQAAVDRASVDRRVAAVLR